MAPNTLTKAQNKMAVMAGGIVEVFIPSEEKKPLKQHVQFTDVERAESGTFHEKKQIRIYIITITIFSLILNVAMSLSGFVIAAMRDSAATYAFAADCLLDMLSSSILLWRYWSASLDAHNKERKACIFLGSMFVISAMAVIAKAGVDISQREPPYTFRALYFLSIVGMIFCLFMAVVKGVLARKALSDSLMLDAVNSAISGLLALVIIISSIVYKSNHAIWYLDPVLSILISMILIVYGAKVVYNHREKEPDTT